MKKILFFIFVFMIINSLFARYLDIPVTRDPNSDGNYEDLEKYRQTHPEIPTQTREVSRSSSTNREEGGVLIVVEQNLYPQIESVIDVYMNDLAEEDYDVFLLEFSGNSAFDLKVQFMIYYQEEDITGVVLVGDLPFGVFEMFEDFNNNGIWDPDESWVEFPCDLYFSDIDGIWEDNDNNGAFEVHSGDMHPEMFIGRIRADNLWLLPETEAELINSYFARNHLYRQGFITFPSTALAYIDDDWAYWGEEYEAAMALLYEDTTLINEINETTAQDYREVRLHESYEFIQVHVHSGPDAHHFSENNGNNWNLVTNGQIATIQPDALFYNLFACSNSRYTIPNNMGAMYIYGNESCFATIGSTKTGSMLWFEDFYGPLGDEENLGEALRLWWELSVDVGDDWMWQRSWFYGMIIQGDPTLKLQYETDTVINIPADYPTIQLGINAAEDGNTVLVQPGTYVENINFNGKNITVGSFFITNQDTTYITQTIIDGNQNGSVVTFESGEDNSAQLIGFTITNGYATYGGGIFCSLDSNPKLINLIISNNSGYYGGGISIIESNPEISYTKINGNSSNDGGGIYCYNHCSPSLKNVLISDNTSQYGGGICCFENSSPNLENVTITDNSAASSGGGIYCNLSNPIVINSIFRNDSPSEIYIYSGLVTVTYSDIQGGWAGEGNIDEAPLFLGTGDHPFMLQDLSPCVNAGIPDTTGLNLPEYDLAGNPRVYGGRIDLGAYENQNVVVSAEEVLIPLITILNQNYPNPFNPSTTISFNLTTEHTENTELVIYNLKGQKIKTFLNLQITQSPNQQIVWDGTGQTGKPVSSGIYFYKLKTDNFQQTRKMLLMK